MHLHEIHSSVHNVFCLRSQLLQNPIDLLPDDHSLLVVITKGVLDRFCSLWVAGPLGRDVGDTPIGGDDADGREEALVWDGTSFCVDVLDRRHVDERELFLKMSFLGEIPMRNNISNRESTSRASYT